jgi:N6-adenosine-specific RNA methylase IME4
MVDKAQPLLLSSILFAAVERDVFVLDISMSIALAQGTSQTPFDKRLVSTSDAITEQWPSTEPKSEVARANVKARQARDNDSESLIEDTVQQALKFIKDEYSGSWYLPRGHHHTKCIRVETRQRKIDSIKDDSAQHDIPSETSTINTDSPSSFLASLVAQSLNGSSPPEYRLDKTSKWTPWHSQTYTNLLPTHSTLTLKLPTASSPTMTFHLPPLSTFFLSTLPPPTLSSTPIPSHGFDLILLDPPWPNRSARRRRAYSTVESVIQAINLLQHLNLNAYLPVDDENGTVCIWCTNKPGIRAAVTAYLTDDLGLSVTEEWIWVKVTTKGEPVLPLDSIWRKPWEVLLVGQRRRLSDVEGQSKELGEEVTPRIRRRVIAAMPDEHSRKPCLTELFETLLGLREGYEALEVFARNLTAGWHAWGNEVLLSNWEGYWMDIGTSEE